MIPAMVLCAGFGTRLRPITDSIPKPLLPVGDRAAFLHVVEWIESAGFGPVVMNTHHRADAFDGRVPRSVRLVHEADRILGTAGGLANAAAILGEGEVLVWNGDVAAQPDLGALLGSHRKQLRPTVASLLAARRACGEGTLGVDESGGVVRLRGETFGHEISGADFLGIQIVGERGRELLPIEGCLVGDVYLPALRRGERVAVAWHDGDWVDIGSPRALLEANLRWLRKRGLDAWIEPGAQLGPGVSVRESVVCEGASVSGSGAIEQCLVLPGATVQAPAARLIALGARQTIAVDSASPGAR